MVRKTEEAFGPVDLFCANAGILIGGGVEVPDADWERIWAVNVMSHVYAVRAVLPAMIERGQGYLLHTASAAGLLTQLGSAPYSVTKHAVVALAEWLSITHAADGIKVSCLCPQGVWTNMTGAPTDVADQLLSATAGRNGMLMPDAVASTVVEALADERFLVLPHPEVAVFEQRRAGDRERWLGAMRRIQAEITPP
jgi:NAD(P)-dependent dehydrogenase (short-subunit alcohol dehydrogenase family)